MPRIRFSVAARVTAAFSFIVLVLTLGAVGLVAPSLRGQLEQNISRNLLQDTTRWTFLLEQEGRVLSAVAAGAAAVPTLRAALANEGVDRVMLEGLARDERALLETDLLLLTGKTGQVRASSLDEGQGPTALPAPEGLRKPYLLTVGDRPYWVVASPVVANGRTEGFLVLGTRLGSDFLERVRSQFGSELLLHSDALVHAHVLRSTSPEDVLEALPPGVDTDRLVEVKGKRMRMARLDLGPGVQVTFVHGAEEEFSHYRTTLVMLLGLGLVGTLVAGLLAFLLARRITGPLRELTAAAARVVAEGDFRGLSMVGSSDEIGELATSFARMIEKLRSVLLVLRTSARQLESAAAQMSDSAAMQNRAISRQAAALQETQVTARELQQTSKVAAQRAQTVLEGAERADALSSAGETALESSVGGLLKIRIQVEQIAYTIQELHQNTVQIGGITETVKDLASQSNMLALNAGIEAVRSGEHGKGFSVVAREMRSLADQSARAAMQVQQMLNDITNDMTKAAQRSESGAREVEGGLTQVHAIGESLRALAAIVKEHGETVRQIAHAVNQQDAGISQLFIALSDLNALAEESVNRLTATEQAAAALTAASREVGAIVSQYKL